MALHCLDARRWVVAAPHLSGDSKPTNATDCPQIHFLTKIQLHFNTLQHAYASLTCMFLLLLFILFFNERNQQKPRRKKKGKKIVLIAIANEYLSGVVVIIIIIFPFFSFSFLSKRFSSTRIFVNNSFGKCIKMWTECGWCGRGRSRWRSCTGRHSTVLAVHTEIEITEWIILLCNCAYKFLNGKIITNFFLFAANLRPSPPSPRVV